MSKLNCLDIGRQPYINVLQFQEKCRDARIESKIQDLVILCQHDPVYTIGKQDCSSDWLSEKNVITDDGIEIVQVDRGGRITYHGPGQLVAYFILDVKNYSDGVRDFVSKIEASCIDFVNSYGFKSARDKEHPGVWLDDSKIAAIGLHITKNISMHGMALNVNPNLNHYKHIVPCGIADKGVTTLSKELGRDVCIDLNLKNKLLEKFESNFGCEIKNSQSASTLADNELQKIASAFGY